MCRQQSTEQRILVAAWYNQATQMAQHDLEQKLQSEIAANTEANELDGYSNSKFNNLSFLTKQRRVHLNPPRGLTSVVTTTR